MKDIRLLMLEAKLKKYSWDDLTMLSEAIWNVKEQKLQDSIETCRKLYQKLL